jgi:hypothetical protein
MATCSHHAAHIGMAARFGVPFKLAMTEFIRSKTWPHFSPTAIAVNGYLRTWLSALLSPHRLSPLPITLPLLEALEEFVAFALRKMFMACA